MKKINPWLYFLVIITTLLYILSSSYFYVTYSQNLEEYNFQVFSTYNTLQNISQKIYQADSELYQSFIPQNLSSSPYTPLNTSSLINGSSQIISQLLGIQNSGEFSNQNIATTIDNYQNLKSLQQEIIAIQRESIFNEDNNTYYSPLLSNKIEEYDKQIKLIMNDLSQKIELNKQKNIEHIQSLKQQLLIYVTVSTLFYILSISILVRIYPVSLHLDENSNKLNLQKNTNSINTIISKKAHLNDLEPQYREIITYIDNEIKKGDFPTFGSIKEHFKISHPTLLSRITYLENNNIISIKKSGRLKYVFLK